MKSLRSIALSLAALWCAVPAGAAEVALRMPELSGQRHVYYQKLLEDALKAAGHTAKIEVVKNVPQPRIWYMVENDEIDVFWGLQTKERDTKYPSIGNNLTNGLIGKRILLIPKGDAGKYEKVTNAADLKALNLTGAFGTGWFDGKVWAANQLAYREIAGDLAQIYKMVEAKDRGVDYFARGANEVVEESKNAAGLQIEPKLVIAYDRDVRFYLSKEGAKHKAVIEEALAKADSSGLKKKLIDANFSAAIASLDLPRRTTIALKSPTD